MGPTRPLRLMPHDRSRRDLGRPINPQAAKMMAWPAAKAAVTSDSAPAPIETQDIPEPTREGATAAVPLAIMLMIGVSFGGVVGLVGWPVLQALGAVNEPVVETVQRNHGDLISKLDETVHVLNAAIAELSARVDAARDRQEATTQLMTDIDASVGALRKSMHEMRDAQNAARDSWSQPVAELNAAATKARSDIVRLRASVDELTRLRRPEAAAVRAQVDRIERALAQPELPGAIRGSIPAPGERPRSLAARETLPAVDGHIFTLKPAP